MSTSELGYLVAQDATYVTAANRPLDDLTSRMLLNNANHLMDEFAQVLVTWADADGLSPSSVPAGGNFLRIIDFRFPVRLRQSSDAYLFRVRIAGAVAGGATAQFFAVITADTDPPSPGGTPSVPVLAWGALGSNGFMTATTTSATSAWLTGASRDAGASPTLMKLPAATVSTTSFPTTVSLGGGVTAVDVPYARLTIYGSTTNVGHPPLLTGVYLAEYVGT